MRLSSLPFKAESVGLLSLLAIYCLWGITLFFVLEYGVLLTDPHSPFIPLFYAASATFFVILASLTTTIFMVYADPLLQKYPRIRLLFAICTVLLGISLFIWARQTGNKHFIIFILASANLIVLAHLIGTWLVTPLKRSTELIHLSIVMSLADMFSILSGPTGHIAESIQKYYKSGMKGDIPAGDFLLIKIAIPGFDTLMPVFGVSDWIIVTFFSAAAVRFRMNDNIAGQPLDTMIKEKQCAFYLPVASAGLLMATLFAQISELFLPALPVISVIFLADMMVRYPDMRRFTSKDWLLISMFASVMTGIWIIL